MKPSVRLALVSGSDQAEFIAAAAGSRKLHAPWVSPPVTADAFGRLVERMQGPSSYGYLARRTDTGEIVGFLDITNIVRGVFQSAYLSYYAFAGHERQGFMHAALKQLLRTAFGELKLHRLEANIQPTNKPSIALVRSCGFQKEGYSPRYLKIRGRWRDHERWAILAR